MDSSNITEEIEFVTESHPQIQRTRFGRSIQKVGYAEDEDGDSSDDEGFPSSDRNRKRQKDSKGRTSKSTKFSKRQQPSRRKRVIESNIDVIEEFEENYIFQALSSSDTAIAEIASSWLDEFNDSNKYEALKDFINFVLRSCGCTSQLAEHDVTNSDSAQETIAEIQALFQDQVFHEYPLGVNSTNGKSDWKDFKKNCLQFIDQIFIVSNERGTLYENDELVELLLTWLGAISTSNLRPLRYASTLFSLQMQTVLCKLTVNLTTFVDRYQRQLDSEAKKLASLSNISKSRKSRDNSEKLETAQTRVTQIEANIVLYKEQKKFLETLLNDIFNTVFAHRYRDIDSTIRQECIQYLSVWIEDFPEFFFESVYIRYFGWLLTDKQPKVRTEVLKVLIKLYQKQHMVTALRQFTSHFKNKLLDMVIYETDFHVRLHTLTLLIEITKKGFLEEEEIIRISSLIFVDNEDLIYQKSGGKNAHWNLNRELAKFIAVVESEKLKEFKDSNNATILVNKDLINLDLKEMIKFHILIELVDESYTFYEENYCNKKESKENKENNKVEKLGQAAQFIYSLLRYNMKNHSFQFIIDYLLFDLSSISLLDEALKKRIELKSNDIKYMLTLLYGATAIYSNGEKNEHFKGLIPRKVATPSETTIVKQDAVDEEDEDDENENQDGESKKMKQNMTNEEGQQDKEFYLTKLINQLPRLLENFKQDPDKFSILLFAINSLLTNNIFIVTNRETGLIKVVNVVTKVFKESKFKVFDRVKESSLYAESLNYPFSIFFNSLPGSVIELDLKLDELVREIDQQIVESGEERDALAKAFIMTSKSTQDKLTDVVMKYCLDATDVEETFSYGLKCMFDSFLYVISGKLELLVSEVSALKDDTDSTAIFKLIENRTANFSRFILDCSTMMKEQLFNSESNTVSQEKRFEISSLAASCYIDIKNSINYLKLYLDSIIPSFNNGDMPSSTHIGYLELAVPSEDQSCLLKLALIKEYRLAGVLGVDLDRSENEDVNFRQYGLNSGKNEDSDEDAEENMEKKISLLETDLCVFTAKLLMLNKVHALSDEVVDRLKLNCVKLGGLFANLLKAGEKNPVTGTATVNKALGGVNGDNRKISSGLGSKRGATDADLDDDNSDNDDEGHDHDIELSLDNDDDDDDAPNVGDEDDLVLEF